MATPSATPLPERDSTVSDQVGQVQAAKDAPAQSEAQVEQQREDLGAVQWYYRDPNGQEQGEFIPSYTPKL
jgi:PERQ amino acid-rich with GYF domain-containing protein